MTKYRNAVALPAGVLVLLCGGQLYAAPASKDAPPAPIPSQILTAKKVFIANGGGDESHFDSPQYSGGPDRLYNEFYAAMKSWGRYELVGSPHDAELVLEVSFNILQPQRSSPLGGDSNPEYDSQFHLTIRDVTTQQTLWGLTEHAQTALLQGNRDKNFEQALAGIIAELHRIADTKQAASQTPGN